jgi:hypothetical protein
MLAKQRPGAQPRLDFRDGNSGPQQLRAGHDTMRSAGNPPEQLFDCPAIGAHQHP